MLWCCENKILPSANAKWMQIIGDNEASLSIRAPIVHRYLCRNAAGAHEESEWPLSRFRQLPHESECRMPSMREISRYFYRHIVIPCTYHIFHVHVSHSSEEKKTSADRFLTNLVFIFSPWNFQPGDYSLFIYFSAHCWSLWKKLVVLWNRSRSNVNKFKIQISAGLYNCALIAFSCRKYFLLGSIFYQQDIYQNVFSYSGGSMINRFQSFIVEVKKKEKERLIVDPHWITENVVIKHYFISDTMLFYSPCNRIFY